MSKTFALIGSRKEVTLERQKLTQAGYGFKDIHIIEPEITTEELLKKVLKYKINIVICVKTKNGQTSFWASELKKMEHAKDPHRVEVFGIDIPPHPHGVVAKSMKLVTMINCSTETYKKAA